MAEMTYRAAVAAGIAQEMERDPNVVFLGEDVAAAGGVFKATGGLVDRFGTDRVRDTPISEQAIIGAAMGAAMTGLRPIAELMFSDFFAVSWDMVANQIAKTRYMTDGQVSLPLVIRTANGGGLGFGAQHSQSIENWAMAIPGLKVVAPSTPRDVVGLLAAAIRDPDPVIFCEQKSLYPIKGDVPEGEVLDRLGHGQDRPARIRRDRSGSRRHGAPGPGGRGAPGGQRRNQPRSDRPPLAGSAGHDNDPRLGQEDRPALHSRGEPEAARVGSGDRLVGRGRRLLDPGRADRADHRAAHSAGGRADARVADDALRGPDHGHHPEAPR